MGDRDCVSALLALDGPGTALTLVLGNDNHLHQITCWSWTELQQQRRYAERVLQAQGLCAGDRVLLSTANNPHFFAVLLATASLGLCLMPLHPDFSQQQLQALLQAQPPRLIIVDRAGSCAARVDISSLQVCEQQAEWLQPLAACAPAAGVASRQSRVPEPDPPLLLFHSSGSTGRPKGMRFTRRMLNNYLDQLHLLYGAFPDQPLQQPRSDRVNVLPATHFGGLCFCLMALLEGRSLHLLRSRSARAHLSLLREKQCQLLLLVPALFEQLSQELLSTDGPALLPHLRHCLAMGESITQLQLQRLSARLGLPVHNAYGMSECLTGIYNRAEDEPAPTGSCGLLRFGEARLLSGDGNEHPETGELCVRNITTVPCYTDDELNRGKYHDGWFHTGDLFRRDKNGHYFFVSRADLMCVINGRNVYPGEVEHVLLEHSGVRACIVAAIRLDDGHQRLAAAVELAESTALSANALTDFYLERGAVYATPVYVQFFDKLPRNGGDKPDRTACAAFLQQGYEQSCMRELPGVTA